MSPQHSLDELPDEARVWIFGAVRPVSPGDRDRVLEHTRRFVEDWTAHASELRAGVGWREDRFLAVAVDEGVESASGCSIDALLRHVKQMEEELGTRLTDRAPVWFRDPERDGTIRSVDRSTFRELAREGKVGPETLVFDPTVQRLGALRRGEWELAAEDSWHGRLLPDGGGRSGAETATSSRRG